ncbi:MAG: helix-turn-helix domain-containing protein [Oscillospiraceae bacterium]|nr:helix-turn-helix domain-containing protein [Oscillospiraceae bacterium]
MDTVKIGKFLAELRREGHMTQEELGEKLGVTNKTVSRWENGNYMPPVEMLAELSGLYGVSINEIISGKRLDKAEVESAAEENLTAVLSDSFSLKERVDFFRKKWQKEHMLSLVAGVIFLVVLVIVGYFTRLYILSTVVVPILLVVFTVVRYNMMMAYVERNVFDGKGKK